MTSSKTIYVTLVFISLFFIGESCKTKKLIQKPAASADSAKTSKPIEQPKPAETPKIVSTPAPVQTEVAVNDLKFTNIQFEFNSAILKTDSYPLLDNATAVLKANPGIKFILNGYASAEGTDEHNMSLSIDRANAVKVYLVNSGINPDMLSTKGNGQNNPIADNNTEEGRILNRRVEIKKL